MAEPAAMPPPPPTGEQLQAAAAPNTPSCGAAAEADLVAGGESGSNVWRWTTVEYPKDEPCAPPCQRSLHVASVLNGKMFVFGGYDGAMRVNDFYEFSFETGLWSVIPPVGQLPTPRDRHISVVYGNSFFVFAGFDGTTRVNDFYEYSFDTQQWQPVVVLGGVAPSPRHSHAAVIHGCSMHVFGGYDGSYRSDFHAFNFVTASWTQVATAGRVPRARYRATCVVHGDSMYLFGGHDGTRHLNDVHIFDFGEAVWQTLVTDGPPPIPRDSHVAVVHGQSMYIFGGSTGSAMNDFHELRLDTCKWAPVQVGPGTPAPGHRFCHVACVHGDSMFVFGGYDGSNRLNDFVEFHFGFDSITCDIPPSSLIQDLRALVNDETLSDITFIVEGQPVYAHKILCMRCPYFRVMLTGKMLESRASKIVLPDVRSEIFVVLLEYLYTDACEVPLDIAMELFQAADQFGVERLKKICESKMLASINVENAASIFHAADVHNAKSLREKCLNFILANFDPVTKTGCFEEMGRTNVELVFEILKKR